MLHAHPKLAIPMETQFFPELPRRIEAADDPAGVFLEFIHGHMRWASFQIDGFVFDHLVRQLAPFDLGSGLRILYRLYAEGRGKDRWGDKSPTNTYEMARIQEVLPEARFVHIIRDGRDVALSVKPLWFGPSTFEDAASWWAMLLWRARGQIDNLDFYYELRYEDLIVNTEATLRGICEFIELPWDPAMLRYYENAGDRRSEADLSRPKDAKKQQQTKDRQHFNELIGKPPQADRVAVWKREMPEEDELRFEDIAGEMLEEFDYPLRAASDLRDAAAHVDAS